LAVVDRVLWLDEVPAAEDETAVATTDNRTGVATGTTRFVVRDLEFAASVPMGPIWGDFIQLPLW
jgi:hypothetical protein